MTICFSQNLKFAPCPNFKLHCLKGLCKFPILLLITVFSKPQRVYVPLHWPQQRLALHSTGGREAPHLQIVTYLRYVTIFMIDTILITIFFTIGVCSIGRYTIQGFTIISYKYIHNSTWERRDTHACSARQVLFQIITKKAEYYTETLVNFTWLYHIPLFVYIFCSLH